ncbi:MAG: quinolinate phosphoribosyl transferase [Thermodesulfobacteriota bacterium]|nr:quinolinate phosphoribosyl transferase [Thermodesulfobacteriota bacterium]
MKKRQRLSEKILKVNPRVADGYYSDKYFNRTKEILKKDNYHPIVRMQIFQKNDDTCICGIDEAIGIIKEALGPELKNLKIRALYDGDIVRAWETVMTIEGDYSIFAHLETVYLGALARRTKVATNVYRCVREAKDKALLFFPARFDVYQVQSGDGYAYKVGREAAEAALGGVSTDAQGQWWGSLGLGTVPHGLIAAYTGDTTKATLKFAEKIDVEVRRIALVDYDNDCVKTTLEVSGAMWEKYKETNDERYRLWGVRLDTSTNMVDESLKHVKGSFDLTGVNEQLVWNVRKALDQRAQRGDDKEERYFHDIGIVVSGGFNAMKIKQFEKEKVPVIAYGVGSSLFKGNFDYTADIVQIFKDNEWQHNAKKGRKYNPNTRLEDVI